MKMNGVYTVFLMVYVTLATRQVLAAQHEVTWDVSTDMDSWASGHTFKVGDQLVFKYTSGLHSVLELSSDKGYANCDIGNALNSMNGGKDVVKLTKPGTRYFACGTLGHCDQGMKLKVMTVATNEGSSQDPPPSSSTTKSTTPTSAAQTSESVAALGFAVASAIIGLLNIMA